MCPSRSVHHAWISAEFPQLRSSSLSCLDKSHYLSSLLWLVSSHLLSCLLLFILSPLFLILSFFFLSPFICFVPIICLVLSHLVSSLSLSLSYLNFSSPYLSCFVSFLIFISSPSCLSSHLILSHLWSYHLVSFFLFCSSLLSNTCVLTLPSSLVSLQCWFREGDAIKAAVSRLPLS